MPSNPRRYRKQQGGGLTANHRMCTIVSLLLPSLSPSEKFVPLPADPAKPTLFPYTQATKWTFLSTPFDLNELLPQLIQRQAFKCFGGSGRRGRGDKRKGDLINDTPPDDQDRFMFLLRHSYRGTSGSTLSDQSSMPPDMFWACGNPCWRR